MSFDEFDLLSPEGTLPSLEDYQFLWPSVYQNAGDSVFQPMSSNTASGTQNNSKTFPAASASLDTLAADGDVGQKRKLNSSKRMESHNGHGTSCSLCERGKRRVRMKTYGRMYQTC